MFLLLLLVNKLPSLVGQKGVVEKRSVVFIVLLIFTGSHFTIVVFLGHNKKASY
jgi:hypothetical protein